MHPSSRRSRTSSRAGSRVSDDVRKSPAGELRQSRTSNVRRRVTVSYRSWRARTLLPGGPRSADAGLRGRTSGQRDEPGPAAAYPHLRHAGTSRVSRWAKGPLALDLLHPRALVANGRARKSTSGDRRAGTASRDAGGPHPRGQVHVRVSRAVWTMDANWSVRRRRAVRSGAAGSGVRRTLGRRGDGVDDRASCRHARRTDRQRTEHQAS